MKFWGHAFRGFGPEERICMACGYVIGAWTEQQAKDWIKDREGAELHCGGEWHIFKKIPLECDRSR